MSANLGNVYAMYCYAIMKLKGDGVSKSIQEAIDYFKKSADLGYVNAMYSYGSYIKNFTESVKYFKKSADLGHAYSMNNYAYMILNGKVKSVDKEEA